jgi:exodeoxyribonuclease-3
MRLLSWNVNGIRAWIRKLESQDKGLASFLQDHQVDIACFQETKVSSFNDLVMDQSMKFLLIEGYDSFWSFSRRKKGWSGVVTYAKTGLTRNAWEVHLDMDQTCHEQASYDETMEKDNEGRILATDHERFWLLNVYFPNAGTGEVRFQYKMAFYEAFQKYIDRLIASGTAPYIIVCGDINTAHQLIDLWDPQKFQSQTGFLPIERRWVDTMVGTELSQFIDTFRYMHPNESGRYTYWDTIRNARSRNQGWRIDAFWLQRSFQSAIVHADIWSHIFGSDHCPIILDLDDRLARTSIIYDAPAFSARYHPSIVSMLHLETEKSQPSVISYFSRKRPIDIEFQNKPNDSEVLNDPTPRAAIIHQKTPWLPSEKRLKSASITIPSKRISKGGTITSFFPKIGKET